MRRSNEAGTAKQSLNIGFRVVQIYVIHLRLLMANVLFISPVLSRLQQA
jgi:hypothetical protein